MKGFLKGAIITDTKVKAAETKKSKSILFKEGSVISSYLLSDQDYMDVVLSVAREMDPRYTNMSLQEIGKDLKTGKIE